jgi:Immunity protein 53
MDVLGDLQKWYAANCNGDWEHSFGVVIESLDNPGWSVKIDLEATSLDSKNYQSFQRESEDKWLFCRVENNKFIGAGDETQLEEILKGFLSWAQSQNEDWLKPLTDERWQLLEDERFLNLLGEEIGIELCKSEFCTHKQIKNSVMCRKHHFEMVQKRPFPENTS